MSFHPRFNYTHAMVRHLGLIESARALATTELWRSGYDMRGFLSLE